MSQEFGPWTEWLGGACPVAGRDGIQIQCRNETREQAEASFTETGVFYMWEHRGGTGDIIAYRIIKPTEDQHRMQATPAPHCETCNGHGLVTYAIDDCGPCPDCTPDPLAFQRERG